MLKIKLAMAIIGISSIHLLRTFIEAGNIGQPGARYTETAVLWQTIIHVTFILSAIGIAMVDRMGQQPAACEGAQGGVGHSGVTSWWRRVLPIRERVEHHVWRTGVVARGRDTSRPHVRRDRALEAHDAVLAPALGALLAHGDAGDIVVEVGHEHGAQRRERAAVDRPVEGDIERVQVLIGLGHRHGRRPAALERRA